MKYPKSNNDDNHSEELVMTCAKVFPIRISYFPIHSHQSSSSRRHKTKYIIFVKSVSSKRWVHPVLRRAMSKMNILMSSRFRKCTIKHYPQAKWQRAQDFGWCQLKDWARKTLTPWTSSVSYFIKLLNSVDIRAIRSLLFIIPGWLSCLVIVRIVYFCLVA